MKFAFKVIFTSLIVLSQCSIMRAAPDRHKNKKSVEPSDTSEVLVYTDEFLDTVNIKKVSIINDYTLIGVEWGVGLCKATFNPVKSPAPVTAYVPGIYGISFTKYCKMFGYMPYFGFQTGIFRGQNNIKFEPDKDGRLQSIDGATNTVYDYIEVPALAHFHLDVSILKIMINAGIYGGYRFDVHREGIDFNTDYSDKFFSYENRFDYGIKAGGGLAFMFSPVELHLTAMVRYGLSSFYKPDYLSEYHYRYAYPFDIILSAGIHFQLTKRTGMTKAQLKKQAREIVYPIQPIKQGNQ